MTKVAKEMSYIANLKKFPSGGPSPGQPPRRKSAAVASSKAVAIKTEITTARPIRADWGVATVNHSIKSALL